MVTKVKSDSKKTLNQAFLYFAQELKAMMARYFDTLDELLYELSEKTDSEIKKTMYLESLQSIRVHKLNVLVSYLKTIQHTFKKFTEEDFDYFKDFYTYHKNKAITGSASAHDVEEKFTQNVLRSKFEKKYKDQLSHTLAAFSLLVNKDLEPEYNPISPYVLISSFAKSIRLLHLDHKIQVVLYKHYEYNLLLNLTNLYDETIKNLSKNNIESINTSKVAPSNNANNDKHTITQSEINDVIIDLESKLQNKNKVSPQIIKKALMSEIELIQLFESRHIDTHDLYNIDYISMRFQVIADNQNIHDTIKNIIFKLQIPYLKYATQDDSFIDDKNHPAQVLLNEIQSSSVGWSEKSDNNQEFINKLNNLIDNIIKPNLFTESFFKEVLSEHQDFIAQLENKFVIEQQRIKNRERGKAQIVAAMTTVDALVELKTENVSLPGFVKNILFGPWKNLLSLLLVRYSDTSVEYLEIVVFIDDLIELINSSQYSILIENKINKLAVVYKDGLQLVAYGGDVLEAKVGKFKDDLMKHHKLGAYICDKNLDLNKNNSNAVQAKNHEKNRARVKVVKEKAVELKSQIFEGKNQIDSYLLAKLSIGGWVEFPRQNKDSIRAQLSWINPKSGKYIFVNDRGLKVTDKSQNEILADLKANKIIIAK